MKLRIFCGYKLFYKWYCCSGCLACILNMNCVVGVCVRAIRRRLLLCRYSDLEPERDLPRPFLGLSDLDLDLDMDL